MRRRSLGASATTLDRSRRCPSAGASFPSSMSPRCALVVGSYRLIYEIGDETVFVLALVHGARDLPALWEDESRGPPPGG